jgi:ABC-type phosphate transport system substrate-binding protein
MRTLFMPGNLRALASLSCLDLGEAPTLENFERGAYPLAKELHFVVRSPPAPLVQAFLAFLQSPEGKAVLRAGHVL